MELGFELFGNDSHSAICLSLVIKANDLLHRGMKRQFYYVHLIICLWLSLSTVENDLTTLRKYHLAHAQ